MVVSTPQTGHVTLEGTGFSYKAAKDFHGSDFFSLMVLGVTNKVPGVSTIEVEVSVSHASELRSFSTTTLPSRKTYPPSLSNPGTSSTQPPPPIEPGAYDGATPSKGEIWKKTFTPLHTYYISPTGSDSNNGTSQSTPWASINHSVNCGDVIIALTGSYTTLGTSGTVSSCPSTSGGIDGTGGIYFAVVLCGGNLFTCTSSSTSTFANVTSSNWAVEGFVHSPSSGRPVSFFANGTAGVIHHVAFINNIAYATGAGFVAGANNTNHDVPGSTSTDYVAFVGNIAQNAEKNTVCTAAMTIVAPATIDNNAGTHFLMYGNFSYYEPSNGCSSDEESFMFDTFDAHGVTNQSVMLNNVGWSAYRFGTQIFFQNFNGVTGLTDYIEYNTLYNNNLQNSNANTGSLNIQQDNSTAPTIIQYNNISLDPSIGCAGLVGGASGPSSLANVNTGTTGNENVLFNSNTGHSTCAFNGYTYSTHNFLTNPNFNNTTDLLTNWTTGAPSCSSFVTVTACMGWNAQTRVLTTLTPVYDLTPTCGSNCTGKGYQYPSTTCVNSGSTGFGATVNSLYPTWLKGIVYLHYNGSTITENTDLVTVPCGM
jgi:hypothetical protein